LHFHLSLELRALELEQHLAFGDLLPFRDVESAHDAAFEVLHGLAVALHGDDAAGDRGAIDRRQRRPAAEPAEDREHDAVADDAQLPIVAR
jgi:hypothetical protein